VIISFFEKQKEEMGFPKDGQKIIFKEPAKFTFFKNVIDDQELLKVGQEYTVKKTNLNSSSSYVWLEEIPTYDQERDLPFFSLWSFTWEGDRRNSKGLIDQKSAPALWDKVVNKNNKE
jgi:hypothetical protein